MLRLLWLRLYLGAYTVWIRALGPGRPPQASTTKIFDLELLRHDCRRLEAYHVERARRR